MHPVRHSIPSDQMTGSTVQRSPKSSLCCVRLYNDTREKDDPTKMSSRSIEFFSILKPERSCARDGWGSWMIYETFKTQMFLT